MAFPSIKAWLVFQSSLYQTSIYFLQGESHVFVCRRLANDTVDLNRYINPHGHSQPTRAGDEQGGVFTVERQVYNNGVVICQFTLSRFSSNQIDNPTDIQKLSQSTPYFPLFATGQLDASSEWLITIGLLSIVLVFRRHEAAR